VGGEDRGGVEMRERRGIVGKRRRVYVGVDVGGLVERGWSL